PAVGSCARPLLVPRRVAGLGVLASEGAADLAHARGRDAATAGATRLSRSVDANPRPQKAVGAVGPLGPLRRQHVQGRGGGPDVLAQAHELSRVHVHLSLATAFLPRPAAATQ